LPEWASFLRIHEFKGIPLWVILTCALTMAAGTAAGGWRIIRTMGHKMVKMQPVHGFAAETTAATILYVTASLGVPVSTTHVISASIMGVGASKRLSAVKWGVVERILWAWVFTLPVTGLLGYGLERLLRALGA
jgi:PiT family inorganic phosphate transporter